ncbi:MAG: hypothetical protein KFBDDELM_00168 [Candidatus Argoarchaeum ethanivorans]|uniref:Uncharacterized protein n=1 Tax=Candidatus Argoarchaeum ethanivorans TaxID=2608793 RepID=A0A811T3P9_9EURY|nr:MAG: hypothetical protein KFBDDELM_00168 [Candidatus Argoarchaeum ethanivorans]CAD6492257.1 MAG: hypothetical protein FFODKBPE_00293 [Candidatus Argoarchaeum ethanivorans]
MGPGEHNIDPYAKKCYSKRCQIKNELARDHDTFFLEEIYNEARNDGVDVTNTLDFEDILIKKEADTVIMIFVLNATGLEAELVAFSRCPELAEKMWVFYDSTYYEFGNKNFWHVNSALDSIEGRNGRIKPFTESEIDSCSLLTRVKNMIEQKRRALSILPYKKYRGVE